MGIVCSVVARGPYVIVVDCHWIQIDFLANSLPDTWTGIIRFWREIDAGELRVLVQVPVWRFACDCLFDTNKGSVICSECNLFPFIYSILNFFRSCVCLLFVIICAHNFHFRFAFVVCTHNVSVVVVVVVFLTHHDENART